MPKKKTEFVTISVTPEQKKIIKKLAGKTKFMYEVISDLLKKKK